MAIPSAATIAKQQVQEVLDLVAVDGLPEDRLERRELLRLLSSSDTWVPTHCPETGRDLDGIDIIAQPPGTKLRTILLLSGGQKTMTAVALLFAIYMVKPSPLCVLDELDAPLDDTNVGRFTDIVRQFTKYSQFLVITHNKRTVSAADAIFGATMQEKGVTRLFSMRFNRDKDEAEPSSPDGGFTMAR